jgi:hypothetical protein
VRGTATKARSATRTHVICNGPRGLTAVRFAAEAAGNGRLCVQPKVGECSILAKPLNSIYKILNISKSVTLGTRRLVLGIPKSFFRDGSWILAGKSTAVHF